MLLFLIFYCYEIIKSIGINTTDINESFCKAEDEGDDSICKKEFCKCFGTTNVSEHHSQPFNINSNHPACCRHAVI